MYLNIATIQYNTIQHNTIQHNTIQYIPYIYFNAQVTTERCVKLEHCFLSF